MLRFAVLAAIFGVLVKSSFLQCSYSSSLESIDDLDNNEYPEKAGFICDEWPFYSGGFPKGESSSSSGSSSSEEDDDDYEFLKVTLSPDSDADGVNGQLTTKCLKMNVNNTFCGMWLNVAIKEDDDEGCGGDGEHGGSSQQDNDESDIEKEYELCFCAESNDNYCDIWACINTESFIENADADSDYIQGFEIKAIEQSDSDDSGDNDDSDDSGDNHDSDDSGDNQDSDDSDESAAEQQYWFAYAMDARSYDWKNCWCKESSLNDKYCLNWYCETYEFKGGLELEYDENGWFGCYVDDDTLDNCPSWYGFLMDNEDRAEYRCKCDNDDCLSSVCSITEYKLRNNTMWYNFYLAFTIWAVIIGIFGTFLCYSFPCKPLRCCILKCVCCRMCIFYILFGFISMIHGGVPCFLFFMVISIISMIIARWRAKRGVVEFMDDELNETNLQKPTVTTINGEKYVRSNSVDNDNEDDSVSGDGDKNTEIKI